MLRETLSAMRALDYPFAIPSHSFVYAMGETHGLGEIEVDRSGRTALLAYGSNAAPEALARKLGDEPDPVLLLRSVLHDFDAVYSKHLSSYGAVPATLHPSPGTELPLFVAYLTAAQLERIELTEPNYQRTALEGIECRPEDGGVTLDRIDAYISRHGHLLDERGSPFALSAIPARGRVFAEIDQAAAQAMMRE